MSQRPVTSAQVRRRDVARRRQRRPRSSAATTSSIDRVHAPLTTTCPSTMAASSSCQPPTSVCRRLPSLNRPASNSSVLKLPLEVRPSSSSFFIDPAPRRCSRSSSTSWLTLSIDLPPNGKRQPVLDYRAYRVPELIPVLGSQPAGDVSHKPAVGCYNFPPGPQLLPQPLRGLLPISLLDEQRHDGCEQFA